MSKPVLLAVTSDQHALRGGLRAGIEGSNLSSGDFIGLADTLAVHPPLGAFNHQSRLLVFGPEVGNELREKGDHVGPVSDYPAVALTPRHFVAVRAYASTSGSFSAVPQDTPVRIGYRESDVQIARTNSRDVHRAFAVNDTGYIGRICHRQRFGCAGVIDKPLLNASRIPSRALVRARNRAEQLVDAPVCAFTDDGRWANKPRPTLRARTLGHFHA